MKMSREIWVIGIHREAEFKVVAVAESRDDAIQIARALSSIGRPLYWKVEEAEKE